MSKLTITMAALLMFALPTALQAQKNPGPMATSECYTCITECDAESYPNGSHKLQGTFFPGFGAGYEHPCIPYGACNGHNDPCFGMAPEESEEFYAALDGAVDGDFNPMLGVIEEYPHLAVLNLDRMHLQINSPCDEDIIVASIPLTSTQVAVIKISQPEITTLASN